MKKVLNILLFLISFNLFGQSNKLPIPSNSFLKQMKYLEDPELKYLEKHFGKGKQNILKRDWESKKICASVYTFNNGIIYKSNNCSESGLENEIKFIGYNKNEIVKFVEWFFKTEYKGWNKSKTIYEPIENDAGCYFEIIETKKIVVLKYNCGC